MKKLLFSAYSLDVGGIETALITLLKELSGKYDITLSLEEKRGIFLDEVPKNVKIITYKPSQNKIILIRKILNYFKQLGFKLKYKNKFDFSGCYATYSFPASFVSRCASKNSALWVHNDYLNFYNENISEYRKFFKDLKVYDYKKIVFVSEMDKRIFVAQFPECAKKAVVCNNLINYEDIIKKSEERVNDFQKEDLPTFINIGRHEEKQKRLSRIIEATERLNKEGYKFRVIFIGTGIDNKNYKEASKDIKNIYFLGVKTNPYPYLKNSDALLMSSEFEGYPVVFVESKILGKPIITTEVSDSKMDIKDKYGIVVDRSSQGVYNGMKQFLESGFTPITFKPQEYNMKILENLEKIFEEK